MIQTTLTNDPWTAMRSGSSDARDSLVNDHLGLVYHMARQLHSGLAPDAEFGELVSAGTLGLLMALDTFEVGRGLAFSTYAIPRIRGAIIDELRKLDSRPRRVRQRQRAINNAQNELASSLGRTASSKELAAKLDIDMETLIHWEAASLRGTPTRLERPTWHGGEEVSSGETTLASIEPTIDDEITHEQEVAAMKDALQLLTPQERTVIGLYFEKGLKLREIAVILRLTESGVSRIRTRALAALRVHLAGLRQQAS